jgi:N-acetylneuraminic acid mutarotase
MKNPIPFLCIILSLFFIHKIILSQESWTPTSVNYAPSGRGLHTVVWTGNKMIIWGGSGNPGYLNSGGVYDPLTNTWVVIDSINAPSARYFHTAVWTGSRMLIWGGRGPGVQRTGKSYDPSMNSWSPIDTANAPSAREMHSAIWTGSKMIIWGGFTNSSSTNTGGIYDPVSNTWTSMSATNAPSPRKHQTAVWTGSKMIIWGGDSTAGLHYLKTGGVYDPSTDTWTSTSLSNCPDGRNAHTAIWTGDKMIIWGGYNTSGCLLTGSRYDPVANGWAPTSIIDVPIARKNHTAIWTGVKMVIWGGDASSSVLLNSGGIYNPFNDNWDSTITSGAPAIRAFHTSVWTGNSMVIWGGTNLNYLNTGGKYTNPTLVGIGVAIGKIPSVSFLQQNYPNPFNPVTSISYGLAHDTKVNIKLYDISGRLVKELISEYKPAGIHVISFNGTNFASGIYFYRIEAGTFVDTKKMVLIK